MNRLFLHNFKAFNDDFPFEVNGKNVLVYGENGAGKSSLFEGIKLFYFRNRLLSERIPPNVVGQARIDEERRVFDDYKNTASENLVLQVDGGDFTSHNDVGDSVFLISYQNLAKGDVICIEDLINNAYFSHIGKQNPWISNDLISLIIEEVSKDLKDYFWMNDIEVHSIDSRGNCTIKNAQNQIPRLSNLYNFFNESIIHVVKFIILIEAIGYFHKPNHHPLLVMDDCFNSLDHPNRMFMMKFLLKKAKGIQKIVFTHNTSFFNLFSYIVHNTASETDNWSECQLAKLGGDRKLLDGTEKTTSKIKEDIRNMSPIAIGNELRKRFEILVYQLSRLNNIGELQETRDLLDKMCSQNNRVFLSKQGDEVKDIYTLVDEIYANVTNNNEYHLAKRLKEKIENFRNHSFLEELKPVLIDLRLLQKVALHQVSHGHHGMPPVSEKEIQIALILLEKLERAISSVSQRVDVSSI